MARPWGPTSQGLKIAQNGSLFGSLHSLYFHVVFVLEIGRKADVVAVRGNPAILECLLAGLEGRFYRYLW